jgi:hypothetical protein
MIVDDVVVNFYNEKVKDVLIEKNNDELSM